MTHKTLESFSHLNKYEKKIIDHMTFNSKNVYNTMIYYTDFYYKYKHNIYSQLILKINDIKTQEILDTVVYEIMKL